VYNRTVWRDHVTEFENRYRETKNEDGSITHEPVEGEVVQQGTPMNETNFNNMEMGIFENREALSEMLLKLIHHAQAITRLIGEAGTVEVTNSQTYPFNNSGKTVAISPARDTTDYSVDVEVLEETGGQAGHVIVYDKLKNGFKVRFTGGASAISVKYVITGGTL